MLVTFAFCNLHFSETCTFFVASLTLSSILPYFTNQTMILKEHLYNIVPLLTSVQSHNSVYARCCEDSSFSSSTPINPINTGTNKQKLRNTMAIHFLTILHITYEKKQPASAYLRHQEACKTGKRNCPLAVPASPHTLPQGTTAEQFMLET